MDTICPSTHLAKVRDYYDSNCDAYVQCLGTTCQSGLVLGWDDNPFLSNNLYVAAHAGIAPNQRVLDAGCGVCGPAIDIASSIEGVRLDGVTISSQQAAIANAFIAAKGLNDRVTASVADYHQLPFQSETFDAVLFLESAGYSPDLNCLFKEALRVLRPKGRVYIKDVFAFESPLSQGETDELRIFDVLYRYNTRTLSEYLDSLSTVGFSSIRHSSLNGIASTAPFMKAMFIRDSNTNQLSPLGKTHYFPFTALPIDINEIIAIKDSTP